MQNLQKEWLVDLPSQRFQENVSQKSTALDKKINDSGVIVYETENIDNSTGEQVKSYTTGEYEIYHGLEREITSVFACAPEGIVLVYLLAANPENRDRKKYFRVSINPVRVVAGNVVTDPNARRIKFMVA